MADTEKGTGTYSYSPENRVVDGWVGGGQPGAGEGRMLGQEEEEAGLQRPHWQHAALRGRNLATHGGQFLKEILEWFSS